MATKIRRWGNSLGVRIPRDIVEGAGMSEGKEIMFVKKNGEISIRPAVRSHVSLDSLVSKITPRNRHTEVDLGKPRGKEIW